MIQKIMLFLFFILVTDVTFCFDDISNIFSEFISKPEIFTYDTYHIDNKEMIFAYQNRQKPLANIFYNLLIVEKVNSAFQPLLYILHNKIITPSGQVIFEGISTTQIFYGWSIYVVEKRKVFSTSFYTNNGINVTEGPTIIWDDQKKEFKLYPVDRSQW